MMLNINQWLENFFIQSQRLFMLLILILIKNKKKFMKYELLILQKLLATYVRALSACFWSEFENYRLNGFQTIFFNACK